MQRLKRAGRFFINYPMLKNTMTEQPEPTVLTVLVDTDHAGCAITRKSTTGLAAMLGRHCVKTQSSLQSTVSLASGESEFYGLVKAAQVGLGIKALLEDWRYPVSLTLKSDSSAARSYACRQGLGKMRHVQTRFLWIQERVRDGCISIEAIRGKNNPADLMTKALQGAVRMTFLNRLGFFYERKSSKQKQVLSGNG